jgi:hypothetical protein
MEACGLKKVQGEIFGIALLLTHNTLFTLQPHPTAIESENPFRAAKDGVNESDTGPCPPLGSSDGP